MYYSHTLATLLADLHRFNEAKELLLTCLNGFERLNDQSGQMIVLQELGNIAVYSHPKKAIDYNQKAMEIAQSINDDLLMANALHGIGVAYVELKQFHEAEKNFQKSLDLTKKVGDTKGLVATYSELAGLMVQMKRLQEAARFIIKAKELCNKTNYLVAIPLIQLREGEILEAKGKTDEARKKYLLANTLFKNTGDKIDAEYSINKASQIDAKPLAEWMYNVVNGRYKRKAMLRWTDQP